MTYAQIFKGVDNAEKTRRLEVVTKMNILWDRRNACLSADERKVFDKKLAKIKRQETEWLKEAAWFLY